MTSFARWMRRAHLMLHWGSAESAMGAEMRHHIECETAERVRQGIPAAEARRQALAVFGGVHRYKEQVRDERGVRAFADLAQDLRYAARLLRHNPTFAATSILTLALGIGLTTAIFSVVHGVLLRPLPYRQPAQLVAVWERNTPRNADRNVVSVPNFEAWRAGNRTFSGMAALVPAILTLAADARHDAAERLAGVQVSPNYFRLLGVAPALGRDFIADDEAAGGSNVVMLSYAFWQQRFAGDTGIIGKALAINEQSYIVVGVMPRDFDPPRYGWIDTQDLWLPFGGTADNRGWGRFLHVVGRVRPGVSLEQVRADLGAIADVRAREVATNRGWSVTVVGLAEQITGDVRRPLLVLLGAVALLLLMAVTNVAGLTLAFARRRAAELTVRRAMGATTSRLARQLLTQSALVAIAGAGVGLLAANAGVGGLLLLMPPDMPRVTSIRLDATVLLLAVVGGFAVTVVFGALAAFRTLQRQPAGARATARLGGGTLVVAEIAIGLVLAVLAGLMTRSFIALRNVDLGFDASNVVAGKISLAGERYASPDAQRAFFDALADRVRAAPGVTAVSVATTRPFAGGAPATEAANPARPPARGRELPVVDVRFVDSAFFAALHVPLVSGSAFSARERTDGTPRIIINQSLARTLWPGENPVGHTIAVKLFNDLHGTVIGVVGDAHLADARTAPRGTVYLSATRFASPVRDLIVRATGEPDAIVAAARRALRELDPGVPLYQTTSLGAVVGRSLARDRFTMALLATFATVALVLAAVGIYGVFSDDVARRQKELGIRHALGAHRSALVLLVLRRALSRAAVGIVIGVVAGLVVARSMSSILFGVVPADPISFLSVATLLLAVAAAATLLPAIRAARASPMDSIRIDG